MNLSSISSSSNHSLYRLHSGASEASQSYQLSILLEVRTFCFRVSPQTFYFDIFFRAEFVDCGFRRIIGIKSKLFVSLDPPSDVSEHTKPSITKLLLPEF